MNVGEYGIQYNMNVNYDISGYTSLSLVFTRPDATTFTVTNPAVALSAAPLVTPLGTFAANQYVQYLFGATDITKAGIYSARLTYGDASKRLISDTISFTVNP